MYDRILKDTAALEMAKNKAAIKIYKYISV